MWLWLRLGQAADKLLVLRLQGLDLLLEGQLHGLHGRRVLADECGLQGQNGRVLRAREKGRHIIHPSPSCPAWAPSYLVLPEPQCRALQLLNDGVVKVTVLLPELQQL